VTTLQAVIQVYPAGSLPSPNALREYEQIVPGIGKRWTDTFFSETEHRRKREKASDAALTRAQIFALVVMVAALAVTVFAIQQAQPIPAGFGFASVAALGYVFLTHGDKGDTSG
jgi:uncharacterized membrane protein